MNKKEGDNNNNDYLKDYLLKHSSDTLDIIDRDSKVFLHQALSTPVMNVVGNVKKCNIETYDHQKILDFHGNSVHQIGYSNEYVIDAIKKQLDTLSFVPRRYTSKISVEAAEKMIELTNNDFQRVLFSTSGSSSISMALKLARVYTKKNKVVTTYGSFHGANLDTISIGGQPEFKKNLGYFDSNIKFLAYDPINCPIGKCDKCDYLCLKYLDYQLEHELDYSAILIEPIRATTLYIPPNEYFKRLKNITKKHNMLLIYDEIPLSLGKTGNMFVYQNYDIKPDILVLGKGLGAGIIPFSAILVEEKLNIGQDISLGHYTHEKNPIACAAFLAQIKYLEEFYLLDHVKNISKVISKNLITLSKEFDFIKDTRCIGNMFAIEVNKQIKNLDKLVYIFLENNISLKVGNNNILLFMPPLVINEMEIKNVFSIIKKIFKEIEVI